MADISYTRTTWADGSEGGTPIDAAKLNNIEQGVVDAVAAIGPNDTTEDGTLKAQIDQNASDISDLQDSVGPSSVSISEAKPQDVNSAGLPGWRFKINNVTYLLYCEPDGLRLWNITSNTNVWKLQKA